MNQLSGGTTAKLSIMMFLQFFIWGAWYVTAPNYLSTIGFKAENFSWTYSVGPIAGILSPFFIGMIADRYFPAQRVLALLHVLGGIVMFLASGLMKANTSPTTINWILFGHMLCYYPTLALTNTIVMRNIQNPERQFPLIRVFGTIGWIVAGLSLSYLSWDTRVEMFHMAAGAAVLLGGFSLFLPSTPPTATGRAGIKDVLGLDALVILKDRSYLVFLVSSMLICIPLAFYYQITSRVVEMAGLPIGQTMSYGQMSEIFFLLIMPFFFARLGVKWMLGVGMMAWVGRFLLFAFGAPDQVVWMILVGVIIHGVCYDFFFVTGQIYTDKKAPVAIRAQAQGLLVLFTLGIGMLIGAQVAGKVENRYSPAAVIEFGALVKSTEAELQVINERLIAFETNDLLEEKRRLETMRGELRLNQLKSLDWKNLWLFPAVLSAGVLGCFLLFFRDTIAAEELE